MDSTTPTPVPPRPVTTSDSGNSLLSFSSLPGLSASPSLDTLREPFSGKDMRLWRLLASPSPLLRDTSTLLSDASLVWAPGSLDSPSVTPPVSFSDTSMPTPGSLDSPSVTPPGSL